MRENAPVEAGPRGRSLEAPRRPSVPERPSIEGLDAKWAAQWDEAGTYHFDRTAPRSDVYSIDTPPPTVSGTLHAGHCFSYTHTDTVARYHRMQGARGLLPDGLGRQRPRHRAAGAELLRRALRSDRRLGPGLRAARQAGRAAPSPCPAPTSSTCAPRWWPRTRRRSSTCGAHWGCRSTGTTPTPPSAPGRDGLRSAASCDCWPGGHAYCQRRRRSGTWTSRRRCPRPRWRSGRSPVRTTGSPSRCVDGESTAGGRGRDRDDPAGAARRLRGPGGPPRRPSLPAAVRLGRLDPAVQGAGPRARPRAGRPRKGLGHRHDLHLRRHHRRDLVARARLADPHHRRTRRPTAAGRAGAATVGQSEDAAAAIRRLRGDRREERQPGPQADRRAAGGVGRHGRATLDRSCTR